MEAHELVEALREEEKHQEEQETTFGGTDLRIVYIGDKPEKRIDYKGRKFLFRQSTPSDVPPVVAGYLLDNFPQMFATPENAKRKAVQVEEAERQRQIIADYRRQQALAQEQADAVANSFVVKIGNDAIDLAKLTSHQLRELAEENGVNPYSLPPNPNDMRRYLVDHFNQRKVQA
ncbi:hypothetical protein [Pectobacterium parmentieri]|uniref:Uncharacterized protein n=1 Tax=Pectobacterium parmentieri TaxID=1905730 RepID=A0A8B3FAG7_PECPM|nr:hypothetical protein [Pectobacterium parmentieri]AOR59555.1 hypothetical protein A8F97_11660 [Pectobacterium parmentieri]AYH09474.1 hypothetical protein C5E24_07105 [Pectobacterium parmentieri]AYH19817.1 hypothetical protein C5E22_15695 [Pectobacterium parmentieri]AYH35787.1 hypothetical protein C5E17_06975 [Pectobacterium parmentieri]AZS55855.1 hypothetical protein C5E18_06810 [Pectobacterium parmentieri]